MEKPNGSKSQMCKQLTEQVKALKNIDIWNNELTQ